MNQPLRQATFPLFAVSIFFSAAVFTNNAVYASGNGVANGDVIENITVTASRTATSVDNVGSSISILTRQDIQRRNATTLAELLRDIPGFAISQQGGVGTLSQARVRGGEANQVLVLIDGVEANDIAQGSEFNFTHMLASDIERIEVVRGPQSALWGADALAGVVHVITVPSTERTGLSASLEGGSFNSANANVSYDGATENATFSLAAGRFDTDGTNVSRNGSEDDGYENTTLRAGGRLSLTDNASLSFKLRRVDAQTGFDDVDFVTTGLPVDAPFETDSTQNYASLAMNVALSERITQRVSLSRVDTENINRTFSPVDDITRGERDSLHLQTNYVSGVHTVSILLEHERDHYEQRGQASFFGDPNKDLDADTTSFAAEYRFDGDLIDVSASLRRDSNSEFDDANTWRLTGLWHVTESTGLFASLGRSIKNPTFTERFGFFDTFIGNPDLTPEHSHSNEIGLRQRFDQGTVSVSYYEATLSNEINGFVFDATSGAFTAQNASGESERKGLEVEASMQLGEEWTIDGSYTWLDATEPGDVVEVRRPENTAAIRFNYAFSRGNVNLGFNYNGGQEDDYFPPVPPFQERVTLPSYTLASLSGALEVNEHITLTGRVENLLDETYEDVFGFRAPGLAAFAGIRATW